jgi:ubiquinone/menaquinone biosynthesis C-methylase UbiE
MRRLFSVPGLRWRRSVKQFEKAVYDRWADTIDGSIWAPWCDRWVESFLTEIPEGCDILDVGCGTGRALLRLAKKRSILLAGIDISPRSVDVAQGRLSGFAADLRIGDAENGLPWLDGTFDVVTMTAVIHHVPHPEMLLRHILRVLKPAGRLIVAEPHFFCPILQLQNLLLMVYPLNGDLHFLSQRGLRRLLNRCGFSTIAQKRAAFFARYTVAQKGDSAAPITE